jgi:diguanylate cyclase (GGDEF)-like protein
MNTTNLREFNSIDERDSSNVDESKNINDIIMILDAQGHIIYANAIASTEFNVQQYDLIGESIFSLFMKYDFNSKAWYDSVIRNENSKTVLRINDFLEKWFLFKFYPNLDNEGQLDSITVTGNDVTMLIDMDVVKDQYSYKDYLTGLINQYGMFEKIKDLHNVKNGIAFFLQILHFTELTNYYGHNVSNKLLNEMVKELKEILPKNSIIARYTESKFVILLINNKNDLEVIDKLYNFIRSSHEFDNLNLHIEKRIGYAKYPEDTTNLEELLTQSSIALKESIIHNNPIVRFQEKMMNQLKHNIEIANKLKTALDNNRIDVYFQKAYDYETDEVVLLEELARWNDEEIGYISPLDFFKIAKDTNQLRRLDRYMVRKSIESYMKIRKQKEFKKTKLTVNVSPETLLDEEFFDYLIALLHEYNYKPGDLYIEISETTFVNNLDICIARINRFKEHGFLIALDDFGTEYSSLSILESVNFDVIKIDQHFIKNINKIGNQEIIKMIRRITDLTSKKMVAEGVETKEQSELLTELGCVIQQGYYLHKPENLLRQ